MAKKISDATAKNVTYQNIPEEAARQGMLASGVPAAFVRFILLYFAAVKNGKIYPPTSAAGNLLGRPPRTFDEWAADNAKALAA